MEALQTVLEPPLRAKAGTIIDFKGYAPVTINRMWCKGCDICSALCPKCVIEPDRDRKATVVHPEACTQCGICWMHCPDFAITSTKN